MSIVAVLVVVFALLTAAAYAVRALSSLGRGRLRDAVPSAVLLIIALLPTWLLGSGHLEVGSRVVVVVDQPPANIRDQLDMLRRQLVDAGVYAFTIVEVADNSPLDAGRPPEWHSPHECEFANLFDSATRVSTCDEAMREGLGMFRQRSWRQWAQDLLPLASQCRMIFVQTNPSLWQGRLPLNVDEWSTTAQNEGVTVERIELVRQDSLLQVECFSDIDLPAYQPLAQCGLPLEVVIRGAALRDHAGDAVSGGELSLTLNGGESEVERIELTGRQISDNGQVRCRVPLSAFAKPRLALAPNFARFDMKAELMIGGRRFTTQGATYLPVRATVVVVACGDEKSLRPGRWDGVRPGGSSPAEIATCLQGILQSRRCRDIASFEFIAAAELPARLERSTPDILVLHEYSEDLLTPELARQLLPRVDGGLHLAFVGVPVRPTLAEAEALWSKLLPVWSVVWERPDGVRSPLVVDRSPILCFDFDYNSLWTGSDVPCSGALEAQVKVAEGVLESYRAAGLIQGTLSIEESIPGQSSSLAIRYQRSPADTIIVCVVPRISAAQGGVVDADLANMFLPSARSLRLGTLFPHLLTPAEQQAAGITLADAPEELRAVLDCPPGLLANTCVLSFVGRIPQPASGSLNTGTPIRYVLNGDQASPRELLAVPPAMTSRLAIHGIRLAEISIRVPKLPGEEGPGFEQGIHEMTIRWPKAEPQLFKRFSVNPSDDVGASRSAGIVALLDKLQMRHGWPLTAANAEGCLDHAAGVAWWGEINARLPAAPATLGTRIAEHWLPLLGPSRGSMFAATSVHGRAIDERFGPLIRRHDAETLQRIPNEDPGQAPTSARWAAPRRFQCLDHNLAWERSDLVDHIVAISPADTRLLDEPTRLMVGGRRRHAHVFALAWSPLEQPPNTLPTSPQDTVWTGDEAKVDFLGPQRFVDLATFLGRIQRQPQESPIIQQLVRVDARESLRVEIRVSAQQLALLGDYTPQIREESASPSSPTAPLSLVHVDAVRALVTMEASPHDLRALFSADLSAQRMQIEFVPNRPVAKFTAINPPASDWANLAAVESVSSLVAFTGGNFTGDEETLVAASRDVRSVGLPIIILLLSAIAAVRTRSRFQARDRRLAVDLERGRLRQLDVDVVAEELGRHRAQQATFHCNTNEVLYKQAFTGVGDADSLVTRDLLLYELGLGTQLRIDVRTAQRCALVTIVCHVGMSMRSALLRGQYEPKLDLTGKLAGVLGSIAIQEGALPRLIIVGTDSDDGKPEVILDLPPGPTRPDELITVIMAASRRRPTRMNADPEDFPLQPGEHVIWLSDFKDEFGNECWRQWAQDNFAMGRSLAMVHVGSEAETWHTGWVLAPGKVLDRTGWTHQDLVDERDDHVRRLRDFCEQAHISFATIDAQRPAAALANILAESRILE